MNYDICLEGLTEDLAELAELIGIDVFVNICENFGGSQIYFPKKDSIFRSNRNKKIRGLYNGENIRELSKIFGISKEQIRKIIKEI